MRLLAFILALPLLYLISILPFPVLYLFARLLFFILYRVMGYRKQLVFDNLKKGFPGKSDDEIRAMRKVYFMYLSQLVTESFKTLTISKKNMLKHCRISDEAAKLFDDLYESHGHVIVMMGHFGNWEWAGNSFSLTRKHKLSVVFATIKNPYFNRFVHRMRKRFGIHLIPRKHVTPQIIELSKGKPQAFVFISDQAANPRTSHWMQFLGQDTTVNIGAEHFAKRFNYPVVYVMVDKERTGYYCVHAKVITLDPSKEKEFAITEKFNHFLEADILKKQITWNWSHKRWKHKRPELKTKLT